MPQDAYVAKSLKAAIRRSTCATIACGQAGRLLPEEAAAAADWAWEPVVARSALDRAAPLLVAADAGSRRAEGEESR